MNNMRTAEIGFLKAKSEIERLGGNRVSDYKKGNKRFLTFDGKDDRRYTITTRSKKTGTWQTSTTYGRPRDEKKDEIEFWVFIDISYDPPKFYVVPKWWIQNDIYLVHQEYLARHGGRRKENDKSIHHSIARKRIKNWENQWQLTGL
jgi:hypothetical protein